MGDSDDEYGTPPGGSLEHKLSLSESVKDYGSRSESLDTEEGAELSQKAITSAASLSHMERRSSRKELMGVTSGDEGDGVRSRTDSDARPKSMSVNAPVNPTIVKIAAQIVSASNTQQYIQGLSPHDMQDVLVELIKQIPNPPDTVPSASGNWDPPSKAPKQFEENTLRLFTRCIAEANISKLASSGDLELLRHFMLTQEGSVVANYAECALEGLAEEDPFVRGPENELKQSLTSMFGKKKTEEPKPLRASYPDIRTNKNVLTFNQSMKKGGGCKTKTLFTDKFTIRNDSKLEANGKISIIPSNTDPRAYSIKIEPSEFLLKKHKEVEVTVSVEIYQGSVSLQEILSLDVVDGKRVPVIVRIQSEPSLFGVSIDRLPCVEMEDGSRVPQVLLLMEEHLISMGGLDQVGIFRLAPDEYECAQVKKELNKGSFKSCGDVNCLSNLIKVWFRELPVPVLQSLDYADIMAAKEVDDCVELCSRIPEPTKSVLQWMVNVLSQVVRNEEVNKMGTKNCAIVMGPNMYHFDESSSPDPMQALVVSNKCCTILSNLLVHHCQTRYGYTPK